MGHQLDVLTRSTAFAAPFRKIGLYRRLVCKATARADFARSPLTAPVRAPQIHARSRREVMPRASPIVVPDDYGKVEVRGEIISLSTQHIAIRRHDHRVGETVVHFPRAGFIVSPS